MTLFWFSFCGHLVLGVMQGHETYFRFLLVNMGDNTNGKKVSGGSFYWRPDACSGHHDVLGRPFQWWYRPKEVLDYSVGKLFG